MGGLWIYGRTYVCIGSRGGIWAGVCLLIYIVFFHSIGIDIWGFRERRDMETLYDWQW